MHIHIYENCSANMLSVKFFDRRDVTHFLADYKEPGQPVPAKNSKAPTDMALGPRNVP